jgi:hypothetical protein
MGKARTEAYGTDDTQDMLDETGAAERAAGALTAADLQGLPFDPADAESGSVTFIDDSTLFFSAMDDVLQGGPAVEPGQDDAGWMAAALDPQPGSTAARRQTVADGGPDDASLPDAGVMTFPDGSTLTYRNVDHLVLPCFTPGTMVQTDRGEIAVEALAVGHRVLTRDRGYQKIVWIGRQSLAVGDWPNLAPVRIARGALGPGMPTRDMDVSPQLRLLVQGPRTKLLFGEIEVLVPALHLVGYPGIARLEVARADYIHIMCPRHEVIWCDGIWSESFQPNPETLGGLTAAQRVEIERILPELQRPDAAFPAARRTLQRHEADLLLS